MWEKEEMLVTSIFFSNPEFMSKIPQRCKKSELYGVEPHSSVVSIADLRTGGHIFDPRFGQYSFPGLMIVIVTGFISLSLLSILSTILKWESSQSTVGSTG